MGLWTTDGTEGGTVLVKNITSYPDLLPKSLVPAGGLLFFVARDDPGRELWRSDGTADGTHLVADICNADESPGNLYACGPWTVGGEPNNSSSPAGLAAHAGKIYFSAYHPDYGRELFRSDGSTVELVADIYPGRSLDMNWGQEFPNSSSATPIADIDGTLYFSADDGQIGLEPWTLRSWTPQEGITDLIGDVQGLVAAGTLKPGQGHSLLVNLEQALQSLEAGDTATALTKLEDFIPEVRACEHGGRLTAAEAGDLVERAERVIASISG